MKHVMDYDIRDTEKHSADGHTFILRVGEMWRIVWKGELKGVEMTTRELARRVIRGMKKEGFK